VDTSVPGKASSRSTGRTTPSQLRYDVMNPVSCTTAAPSPTGTIGTFAWPVGDAANTDAPR
jgi:hypothetical protein